MSVGQRLRKTKAPESRPASSFFFYLTTEATNMNFDKLGGRKFVLAIISLIAGLVTHVLSAKGLTSEVVGLIVGVIGTFSVANTVATVKSPGSQEPDIQYGAAETGELIDSKTLETTIANQTALLEQIAVTVGQTQQLLINAMQAGSQNKG